MFVTLLCCRLLRYVFHVCLDLGVGYGGVVCVVVCCLFLTSVCCLLCCDVV